MGSKRIPIRRNRHGSEAEFQAWNDVFTTGFDFFGDLEPFGFPWGGNDADARAAAQIAWRRFGARFMAEWQPSASRAQPWAIEAFGDPYAQ